MFSLKSAGLTTSSEYLVTNIVLLNFQRLWFAGENLNRVNIAANFVSAVQRRGLRLAAALHFNGFLK